jgi:hypothetical protein
VRLFRFRRRRTELGPVHRHLKRLRPGPHIRTVSYYDGEADLPQALRDGVIAVIRDKWAIFNCPCHAGHVVRLNLSSHTWPRWRLDVSREGEQPTIDPSINLIDKGLRCHFFLWSGQVYWTHDATGPRREARDPEANLDLR